MKFVNNNNNNNKFVYKNDMRTLIRVYSDLIVINNENV